MQCSSSPSSIQFLPRHFLQCSTSSVGRDQGLVMQQPLLPPKWWKLRLCPLDWQKDSLRHELWCRQGMTLGGEDTVWNPLDWNLNLKGWKVIIYHCVTLGAQCTKLIISQMGLGSPNLWRLTNINLREKGEKRMPLKESEPFLVSGESSPAHPTSNFQVIGIL